MSKLRQDAWSEETDLLLAETVLRHIREGSTQLNAFEEVGDRLNRTSAACGFRWNAIVRNQYRDAIEIAKKQRKERKRAEGSKQISGVSRKDTRAPVHTENAESLNLDDVIHFLKNLNQNNQSTDNLEQENKRLQHEREGFMQRNKELEKKLSRLEREHELVQEDYQSLIQIMERARRMVVLQDEDPQDSSSFRMDKNGNLEKMAK
jgi:prespore-specific regulator